MMSTYKREFVARHAERVLPLKKAGSENIGDPPYAKSFIPDDIVRRLLC